MDLLFKNRELDLPRDASLNVTFTNPMFDKQGSWSLPLSLPLTARNRRAFGMDLTSEELTPHKDINSGAMRVQGDCTVRVGANQLHGTLTVTSATASSVEVNISIAEGSIYAQLGDLTLKEAQTEQYKIDEVYTMLTSFNSQWEVILVKFKNGVAWLLQHLTSYSNQTLIPYTDELTTEQKNRFRWIALHSMLTTGWYITTDAGNSPVWEEVPAVLREATLQELPLKIVRMAHLECVDEEPTDEIVQAFEQREQQGWSYYYPDNSKTMYKRGHDGIIRGYNQEQMMNAWWFMQMYLQGITTPLADEKIITTQLGRLREAVNKTHIDTIGLNVNFCLTLQQVLEKTFTAVGYSKFVIDWENISKHTVIENAAERFVYPQLADLKAAFNNLIVVNNCRDVFMNGELFLKALVPDMKATELLDYLFAEFGLLFFAEGDTVRGRFVKDMFSTDAVQLGGFPQDHSLVVNYGDPVQLKITESEPTLDGVEPQMFDGAADTPATLNNLFGEGETKEMTSAANVDWTCYKAYNAETAIVAQTYAEVSLRGFKNVVSKTTVNGEDQTQTTSMPFAFLTCDPELHDEEIAFGGIIWNVKIPHIKDQILCTHHIFKEGGMTEYKTFSVLGNQPHAARAWLWEYATAWNEKSDTVEFDIMLRQWELFSFRMDQIYHYNNMRFVVESLEVELKDMQGINLYKAHIKARLL